MIRHIRRWLRLRRIEAGKTMPTPDELERIADALGVTPQTLTGTDERLYLCIGGPLDGQLRPCNGPTGSVFFDREFATYEYRLYDWPDATGPALYFDGRVPQA